MYTTWGKKNNNNNRAASASTCRINWSILLKESFTALADGNQQIQTRKMTLEFSLAVFPASCPHLVHVAM